MADFKLISADSHVVEPAAAWERVQKEYGERAPRIVRDPPGQPRGLYFVAEGRPIRELFSVNMGRIAGKRQNMGHLLGKEGNLSAPAVWEWSQTSGFQENLHLEDYPGGWDPAARLKDQDQDGVAAEVLFPSEGMFLYPLPDASFRRAILRSYNAWLHEFCSYNPKRLLGLAMLSLQDIEHAVSDVQEYAKQGFLGVMIPTGVPNVGYYEPRFEPFWAAAEEAGVVINTHTNIIEGGEAPAGEPRVHRFGPRQVEEDHMRRVWGWQFSFPAARFVGYLMFSGVFDRHPNLKVVCAENDVGWVAHLVQQVDYWYGLPGGDDARKGINKLEPSEYLKRNIFFTFQDDRAGMLTTPVYGEDNFLWGSDYPHKATTWPYSQQSLDINCEGLDPRVKRKVARENANKLYHLGL